MQIHKLCRCRYDIRLAWLLLIGLLPAFARAGDASVPAEVLSELRAANAARAELLREQQEWELEKARLELLRDVVREETESLRRQARDKRADAAELEKQAEGARRAELTLEQTEAMIDAVAEKLERKLDAVKEASLPGLIPPDTAQGLTDPGERLAAGVQRLSRARRNATKAGVEVVVGHLAGREMTVKLLRLGGAAACWMALDGSQAGTATIRDGGLALKESTDPRDLKAIRKAFATAESRLPPEWIGLPLPGSPNQPRKGSR